MRSDEEVALAFPKRLSDGEQQVLALRPHWLGVVSPLLFSVALLAGMGVAVVSVPEDWPSYARWGVFGAFVLAILLWPVRRIVVWVTSEFLITTERVIHRVGWLTRRQIEIPISGIADVIFSQNLLQRIGGVGNVVIESTGGSGFTRLDSVEQADDIHRTLYELLEEARAGGNSHASEDSPLSPLDQIEQLARLKDRGLLTEQEFELHKERLLKRL